ncbi:MAG: hypothetical protein C0405_09805 [Desulfovibrio sp.]|nr:hypothetical protein [Desulfovibrio sp.]
MTKCALRSLAALLLACAWLAGCASIAPYSQKAYEQATSLKVEALAVMDKAESPFAGQKAVVEALRLNLDKAYEYAKGRPKNEISTRQWAILKDPSRNSLGGFLKRWEEKQTLSEAFIAQAKDLVADGFDTVIGLESGKIKPADAQTP